MSVILKPAKVKIRKADGQYSEVGNAIAEKKTEEYAKEMSDYAEELKKDISSNVAKQHDISYKKLETEHKSIKDYILAAAIDFKLKDGTVVSKAIDSISEDHVLYTIGGATFYGANTSGLLVGDFFYYDLDEKKFRCVRQLNSNFELFSTFQKYNTNTELFDPGDDIEYVTLPFSIEVLKAYIKAGYTGDKITYSQCLAHLDGIHDDRPAVETAHRIANAFGLDVHSHTGKITIAGMRKIVVKTNVDLSGSELDLTDYNWDILYQIYNEPVPITISDPTTLTHDITYVPEWDDNEKYPPMTAVLLSNPHGCKRVNRGETTWEKREELVVIANNGHILYPPIDDAIAETTVEYAYPYPDRRVVFKGCLVNIRATAKTSVIWFMRVDRSNTEVRDFIINPVNDAVLTNEDFKGALFTVKNAVNVKFQNIVGRNMAGKPKDDSTTAQRWATSFAGYVFHSGACAGVRIENCYLEGWWGSMAYLFAKDVHVSHCNINRIDTHDYCSDLFINDCVIGDTEGYINMGYGHGTVSISNVKLNTYGERFLTLRSDYGNLFDGCINIANCFVNYSGTSRNFYIVDAKSNFSQSAFDANERKTIVKPKLQIVNTSVSNVKGSVNNEFFPTTVTCEDSPYTDALFTGKTSSILDDILAITFGFKKSGKIWKRKIWRHDSDKPDIIEELDGFGLGAATPATDTATGVDPYLDYEVFRWYRCNYTRDDDGVARVTALKGSGNYSETGAADVGTLSMTFYWNVEPHDDEGYDLLYFSDMPNEAYGLVPWYEAVKADGTVLPYYIDSAYNSVEASDGTIRSQPGKSPWHTSNAWELRQLYQQKGFGYNGAGMSTNTLQVIMLALKYLTKNSQSVFKGCTSWNYQYNAAVAETGVKRILLTESQAKTIAVGGCVSLGVADAGSKDRNKESMHSIINRGRVSSKKNVTVNDTAYVAVYIDTDETFDTTTDTILSTMPQWTGMTDDVLDSYDGSPVSNTNGVYPYRIKGIEYGNGQSMLASDIMLMYQSDYSAKLYYAAKGVERVYQNYDTAYEDIGTLFAPSAGNTEDIWISDYHFDVARGLCYPLKAGGSANEGAGDKYYAKAALTSGFRTYLMYGRQSCNTDGGALCLYPWYSQWHNDWDIGSRD